MAGSGTSGLFGTPKQVAVERGLAEFRSGRPVIVRSAGERVVALPVDGMSDQGLAAFRLLCAPERPHLLVTARRARALGLDASGPTGLAIGDLHNAAAIFSLAARAQVARHLEVVAVNETAPAAIELAKLAQLLPALLVADASATAVDANEPPLVDVAAEAVAQFRRTASASLAVVAETAIPLNGGIPARFVVFRDAVGGTPIAVIIGQPDLAQPVSVRLHSACLTGDVFGSRRCDCGDHLRLALPQLEHVAALLGSTDIASLPCARYGPAKSRTFPMQRGSATTHFGFHQVPIDDKQALVDDVFRNVAGRYDLMNDLMSGGLHRAWKDALVTAVNPPAGERRFALLDLAGGTGDIAARVIKAGGAGTRVTVLDINPEMIAVGRARVQQHALAVTFIEGNAEALPLRDGSFDAVTIAFGIRNLSRIETALAEAHRVLRIGGRFLCLEFSTVDVPGLDALYDFYSFNLIPALGGVVTGDAQAYRYLVESIRRFPAPEALARMMREAGFARVSFERMTAGVVALHSGWRL